MMPGFTRRKLIVAIGLSLNAGLLTSCDSSSNLPNASDEISDTSDHGILADVAFILFPHSSLNDEVYGGIASALMAQENPAVVAGLAQLKEAASPDNWIALNNDEKTALLETMQGTDFFTTVRVTAINILYGDPAFFELIGYGGSSIEQGGYINRGFDDIDWLPGQGASL